MRFPFPSTLLHPRLVALAAPLCFAAAAFSQPSEPQQTSAIVPIALRCDWGVDPLGVDSATPRLSWQISDPDESRGQRESAWQVLVATTREQLSADRGNAWDSGRVEGDEQLHIPYAGSALRSSEQVFWKVRVWDKDGVPSRWSDVATWTMGVLARDDWDRARWITHPGLLKLTRAALGFHSQDTSDENAVKWVQLDLGSAQPIDSVKLLGLQHTVIERLGFPRRFKIEAANTPEFREPILIADQTSSDANIWVGTIEAKPPARVVARYVRLTATKLRVTDDVACLALSQIVVTSGEKNIATGAKVSSSDSIEMAPWSSAALTDGLGVPGTNPRANATLLARREFSVRAGLKRALVHVSGLGQYEMSINGARVGSGLITPGWTDYMKTCLYDTHDVTALVRSGGANAIGLTLASGFYNVQPGRYVKFVGPFRPLTAIAQLRLEYDDGSVETIVTDDAWRVAPGPITFSSVYGGEDYDARLEPAGWNQPGFDDSTWTHASATDGPGGALRGFSHASPAFRTFEQFTDPAPRTLRPGVFVYDLKQNASFMIRLAATGEAGASVKIIPAELINADGSVDRGSSGRGDAYWKYTFSGRAEGEEWTPKFFYHGCRYLQVECTPAEKGGPLPGIKSLVAMVAHSDSPADGTFSCSNQLFTRIRTLVRWAQASNLAHVLTDCPHRERLGWLEQYHLNGPSLRYEFDLARLYAKTFRDMADAQTATGLVPDIAPEYTKLPEGFRDSPEWGSAVVLAAWQHYVWTGDDAPLRENYDVMQRYVAYLASKAHDHILDYGLGDWYDVGPKPPGVAQLTPIALTATANFYESTFRLAQIAGRLGKKQDVLRYFSEAQEIKEAFNAKFFDAATGTYAGGSQTAQAMPLVLDLEKPEERERVVDALVRDVRARGNAVSAGDVGYRYLLRALADNGHSDVIFDMNNQSEKPGYGYQLAHGATSLTEAWNANRHSSQNHFMLGQIVEWFYGDLAGIAPDPTAPGFKRVIVRPTPVGDVTWATATLHAPRGEIDLTWKIRGGSFSLDLFIPPNTSAEVRMPFGAPETIEVGDFPAAEAPGVKFLRMENNRPIYAIESGRYAFFAPIDPR